MKRAPKMSRNKHIIVHLIGRGDKDVVQVASQPEPCSRKLIFHKI